MKHPLRAAMALLVAAAVCCAQAAPPKRAAAPKPAAAASAAEDRSAAGPPGTISMRFHETSLQEVFDLLSRIERVNILLGKGVGGNVSINLYDVSVPQAIRSVAQAAGYEVEQRGRDYLIVDRQDAGRDAASSNTAIRTYKVQYSNVKQVAEILGKYLSRQGKLTTLPERNLLVVEDAPGFHDRIARLLEAIDVEPRQVLIEAKILEISLDASENFGVDWTKFFSADRLSNIGTTGLAQPGTPGLFFNLVNKNVELFLSAQAAKGRVQTLSTPKLLALENQEASAVIGERVGYKVTTTINQVTTESIQFLETGVILKVVPSVDQRGRVLLAIHPEVSSASVSAGIPSKKSTEVTTQLLCEDGQSVFVGGLIKRTSSKRRTGVPVLGEIPGVGNLFSASEEIGSNTETVVIITPRVVKRPSDLPAAPEPAAMAPDLAR
jgi:type II secretory pathway component GspD/PulD (secretin)